MLYNINSEEEIKQAGYKLTTEYSTPDYEITRLDIKFINPARRENECTRMVLAEISR